MYCLHNGDMWTEIFFDTFCEINRRQYQILCVEAKNVGPGVNLSSGCSNTNGGEILKNICRDDKFFIFNHRRKSLRRNFKYAFKWKIKNVVIVLRKLVICDAGYEIFIRINIEFNFKAQRYVPCFVECLARKINSIKQMYFIVEYTHYDISMLASLGQIVGGNKRGEIRKNFFFLDIGRRWIYEISVFCR